MKSKPSGKMVETSCKECIFAVYENDTQVGCFANRIEKFKEAKEIIEAYDDEKEFYVVSRLCNLYRNQKTHEDLDQELLIANEQSSLSFDLFIECSDISNLDQESILKLLNYKGKFDVRLIHKSSNDLHEKYKILDFSRKIISKFNIDCPVTQYLDFNTTMHSILLKTRKSFHVILDTVKNENILEKVNNLINNEMVKAVVVECDQELFISNLAYKVQSFNDESAEYAENIDNIIKFSKEKELYSCL